MNTTIGGEEDEDPTRTVMQWQSRLPNGIPAATEAAIDSPLSPPQSPPPAYPESDLDPSDSASHIDSDDLDILMYLGSMRPRLSDITGLSKQSDFSAGGDSWDVYRKLLNFAGLVHLSYGPVMTVEGARLLRMLASPKRLGRNLNFKLVADLKLLEKAIDEPELEESYLERRMNVIIVEAISEIEHVEIRHHDLDWNRVPVTLQRHVGLSCPKPRGTIGYHTKGFVKRGKGIKIQKVPPEEDHPLGRKAMEEILRSALREHVPLNYTTARLTSMHEVVITEYKAVNSADAKAIALNQNLNTGFFKVWQDVELAQFLGGSWKKNLAKDPPYCLLFRICGTWWALDWVGLLTIYSGSENTTHWTTLKEDNWAKNPVYFLETLKTTYEICSKCVREKRGSMMKELLRRARASPPANRLEPLEERTYVPLPRKGENLTTSVSENESLP